MNENTVNRKTGAIQRHTESGENWKLIVNARIHLLKDEYELYNLTEDPNETNNLVDQELELFESMVDEFDVSNGINNFQNRDFCKHCQISFKYLNRPFMKPWFPKTTQTAWIILQMTITI